MERLKNLKEHFSFDEANVKIVDDPSMFAKKVNRRDPLLREMVEDMQSRIAKFRDGMSRVEPEDKDHGIKAAQMEPNHQNPPEEVKHGVSKTKTEVKD